MHTPRLKNDPPVSSPTLLAKGKRCGVFPIEKIYKVIDGSAQFQAHRSREMPIWGKEYTTPEMISLLDYLNRIQQK